MYKRLYTLILTLGLCTLGLAGCERSGDNVQAAREPEMPASKSPAAANTISGADKDFILQAEKDGIQERVLGRMAQEQSQNDAVKDYGKMLVKDHNDALKSLVDLMNKNGMPQPKGLPEERSEAVKKLQGLSGAAFDKEFVNMMVMDHQKAINEFRHEAATAQNADVRDYAKDVLPTLEKHLKDAQDLQGKLGSKG
jgi:putative membrane protein